MKTFIFSVATFICLLFVAGCAGDDARYVDLDSGESINVEKDASSGYMVNADTKEPVGIYVDRRNNDTIYGKNGKVINNHVIRTGDGKYEYSDGDTKVKVDDDGEYKVKDGDYKKKVEGDGDVKIKDGDTKVKIDGETGDKKVKID